MSTTSNTGKVFRRSSNESLPTTANSITNNSNGVVKYVHSLRIVDNVKGVVQNQEQQQQQQRIIHNDSNDANNNNLSNTPPGQQKNNAADAGNHQGRVSVSTNNNNSKVKIKGKTYSKIEIDSLLNLLEEKLPINDEDWDVVVKEHNIIWPDKKRDVKSVRRKFKILQHETVSPGYPNDPIIMNRARNIKSKIKIRTGDTTNNIEDADNDNDFGSINTDTDNNNNDNNTSPMKEQKDDNPTEKQENDNLDNQPGNENRRLISSSRGKGFTKEEIDSLFNLIEEKLPINDDEWDEIVKEHDVVWHANKRNRQSLQRKFTRLLNETLHSGQPNDPVIMNRARKIMAKIRVRNCDNIDVEIKHDNNNDFGSVNSDENDSPDKQPGDNNNNNNLNNEQQDDESPEQRLLNNHLADLLRDQHPNENSRNSTQHLHRLSENGNNNSSSSSNNNNNKLESIVYMMMINMLSKQQSDEKRYQQQLIQLQQQQQQQFIQIQQQQQMMNMLMMQIIDNKGKNNNHNNNNNKKKRQRCDDDDNDDDDDDEEDDSTVDDE